MTGETSPPLVEVLGRMHRGEAGLPALAAALRQTAELVLVIPPAEGVRFLQDLDTARQKKGDGPVTASDADAPRALGTTRDDRFVPRVFSSSEAGMAYARAQGLVEPGTALLTTPRVPEAYLRESLDERHGGWIVDDDSDHAVTLDAAALSRLYALLLLEEFTGLLTVHAVTSGGTLHLEREAGGGLVAAVYDHAERVAGTIASVRARVPGAATEELPLLVVLQRLLAAGGTRLIVNPGFTTQRAYSRSEVEGMVARLGRPPAAGPGPTPVATTSAGDPALQGPPGGDRAAPDGAGDPGVDAAEVARHAARPMVPPPGRPDAESERVFVAMAQRQGLSAWETLRFLAYDLDLYVPVLPSDGPLAWPWFHRSGDPPKLVLDAVTREDRMRDFLRAFPADQQRYVRLSGLELARWVWASPFTLDELTLDARTGSAHAMSLPGRRLFNMLYPHFAEVGDLAKIPAVGLARLTALPGAVGAQPEVVRALVDGWKRLLGTRARAGGPARPVEVNGGRYQAAFTTDEQFFAYGSANRAFDGLPVRADAEPPFGRWLEAAREVDGVAIDPGAARPLVLDHTALLLLDLWCRLGRQPQGADLVASVVRLRAGGAIDDRLAGRLIADWPAYFMASERTEKGDRLLPLRGENVLPLFTTPEGTAAHLAHLIVAVDLHGDWEPRPAFHRWDQSALHLARRPAIEALRIDPEPDGSGGLTVTGAVLDAALDRIREHLTPRVPGFLRTG